MDFVSATKKILLLYNKVYGFANSNLIRPSRSIEAIHRNIRVYRESEDTTVKHRCHNRLSTRIMVVESLRKLKDEVIYMRYKMLQEHPEMFNRQKISNDRISKSELGSSNFATWKGANRSERPSLDCMRKILDELGLKSTGDLDVVRRRFKRNVRRDFVNLSDRQRQILKASAMTERNLLLSSKRVESLLGKEVEANESSFGVKTQHGLNRFDDEDVFVSATTHSQEKGLLVKEVVDGKLSLHSPFVDDRRSSTQSFASQKNCKASMQSLSCNLASWIGIPVSAGPCNACMSQLLHQVGMLSTGSVYNIRRQFMSVFRRDNVTFSNQQWHVRMYTCYKEKGRFRMASGHCGRCNPSIDLVYSYMYPKVNQQTSHNGSSTYAEITRNGVSKMIEVISEHFKQDKTYGKTSTFRAIDLGGGYLTCLMHIAQLIPGEYAAIEYCEDRTWAFANSYGKLLLDWSEALENTKIAYTHMDILNLDWYDCDLVYAFDEAFPQAVWGKIIRTFVASPRCKLLITFKPAKATVGYKQWQRYMKNLGLKEFCTPLKLVKKGGECSNAMFMIRSDTQKVHAFCTDWAKGKQFYGDMAVSIQARVDSQQSKWNPSNIFWENSKNFWGDTSLAKKAVEELKAVAAMLQSDAKIKRRERANRKEVPYSDDM